MKKSRHQRDPVLVRKAKGVHPCRNFVLLHDEADILYGNDRAGMKAGKKKENITEAEKAFKTLKGLGPRLKVNVTATPVPLLYIFAEEYKTPHETLSIEPDRDDYIGIERFETLKSIQGQCIFLNPDELKANKGFPFAGTHIPCTCEKTMQLYEHALSNRKAKGILLVDISDHYVYTDDSILFKAECGTYKAFDVDQHGRNT